MRRIVVADNDSLYRVGLHHLLDGLYPGAEMVDARCAEALAAALAAAPIDLVLVDLGLPGLAGYLALLKLLQRHPHVRFVAVSGVTPPLAAQRLLSLGLAGLVSKRAAHDKIAKAVTATRHGRPRLPPREKKLVDGLLRLTPMEAQVFSLLHENPSHRSLMEALKIALPTVKTHMSRILSKLDLRNRTEAAIVAKRLTIFEAPQLYIGK